jgi:hypothetical protein
VSKNTLEPKATSIESAEQVRSICQNCESTLMGPFCHFCGQPVRGPIREFISFISDGSAELIRPDSKLARTLLLMFFRPGSLTARYLDGKRVQFVKPVKLYLSLSLLLFLVLNVDSMMRDLSGDVRTVVEERKSSTTKKTEAKPEAGDSFQINDEGVRFSYRGKPWHAEKNPLMIESLPSWANRWVNEKLRHMDAAARQIENDPGRLADRIMANLPTAMFVLLPLFALILKLLYFFKGRLYAEHLLVAVQSHSFMFLAFTVLGLMSITERIWPVLEAGFDVLRIVIGAWIPIYLFWMQKQIYRQGWIMSVIKYCCVGFIYILLLGLVFAGVFIGVLANY